MTRLRVKRLEENDVPNIGTLVSPISPKDPTSQARGEYPGGSVCDITGEPFVSSC